MNILAVLAPSRIDEKTSSRQWMNRWIPHKFRVLFFLWWFWGNWFFRETDLSSTGNSSAYVARHCILSSLCYSPACWKQKCFNCLTAALVIDLYRSGQGSSLYVHSKWGEGMVCFSLLRFFLLLLSCSFCVFVHSPSFPSFGMCTSCYLSFLYKLLTRLL